MKVTYDTTSSDWHLTETHLHVGESLEEFPLAGRWGNPIPGHFTHCDPHGNLNKYTYEIPIKNEWEMGDDLLIAAHAVVEKCSCMEESAWADGDRFTERGNWGTYFTYTIHWSPKLDSAVYEGICYGYGSHVDDTITLTFSHDIYHTSGEYIEVLFEDTQKLSTRWGKTNWEISGNSLTVTVTSEYSNPRDIYGDKVISVTGLEGEYGDPVKVQNGGVEIEINSKNILESVVYQG